MAEPTILAPLDPTGITDVQTVSRKDAEKYEKYERWYKNEEGLFGKLGKFLAKAQDAGYLSRLEIANQTISPKSTVENLRVPVHRIVEFYSTTMLTGKALDEALPLKFPDIDEQADAELADQMPDREPIPQPEEVPETRARKAAIHKLWRWSNILQRLRVGKRYLARDGQTFIKVVRPEGKDYCYKQFIPTKHVTDFELDDRGNIKFIRIDVPSSKTDDNTGFARKTWKTEIWRKGDSSDEPGYALFAEVDRTSSSSVPAEKVLEARDSKKIPLGGEGEDAYRFDFVPVVVINAADIGDKRPEPIYAHGLHLIAWVCKEATRLSDLMFRFNKAFKVIYGIGNDREGRPMAPPRPGNVRDLGTIHQEARDEHTVPFGGSRGHLLNRDEDISIEGIAVVGLSGNAQMADATPNIDYQAAREWINDHLREIYEENPELLYYAIESRANQSGPALRTLISGAINRAEEMEANLLAGLIVATKMAMTVAQDAGFEGFSEQEIGTFDNGDFEHEIEPKEIMPLTEDEKEDVRTKKLDNAAKLVALGATREQAFEEVGISIPGGLQPQPEGDMDGDALSRAAEALAAQNQAPGVDGGPDQETRR